MVCDPLGDFNVWAATRPLNVTSKGHKMWESVVIAAARVSSKKRKLVKNENIQESTKCHVIWRYCGLKKVVRQMASEVRWALP